MEGRGAERHLALSLQLIGWSYGIKSTAFLLGKNTQRGSHNVDLGIKAFVGDSEA